LLTQTLHAACATVVVCPEADQGMGHSLAHALRSARVRWPHLSSVLVMPADLPWVLPHSVRAVAHALRETDDGIVVPVTESGERGHPVGFSSRHFDALSELTGDAGARALLATHPVRRLLLDDPGILRDIDTPGDLTPLSC
jgi:molybdenum cofactor cytidylyltransferase